MEGGGGGQTENKRIKSKNKIKKKKSKAHSRVRCLTLLPLAQLTDPVAGLVPPQQEAAGFFFGETDQTKTKDTVSDV